MKLESPGVGVSLLASQDLLGERRVKLLQPRADALGGDIAGRVYSEVNVSAKQSQEMHASFGREISDLPKDVEILG